MMKKLFLILGLISLFTVARSQCGFVINITDVTYCQGVNGANPVVNVTGGQAPFSYQLNMALPQANNTFNNVLAGTYTVYVSDASPCTDSLVFTVIEHPSPVLVVSNISDPVCNGMCNGSALATATSGTPQYTYVVTAPGVVNAATGVLSALCSGTYTATVSDANSCVASTSFVVTDPPILSIANATFTNAACPQGLGGINVIAAGGVPAYTYVLAPGNVAQPNGNFVNLAPGSYTVTVADANNCSLSTIGWITAPPTLLISGIAVVDVQCNNTCDGQATILTSGGTPPYTYSINPVAGNINQNFGFISGLCSNTYTLTAMDANGCTMTSIFTVSNPPPIALSVSSIVNTICFGACNGSMVLTGSGGTPPYTYSLSPGLGVINQATGFVSGLCASTYTLMVVDANGCSASNLATVFQPPAIQFTNVTISHPTCTGINDGSISAITVGGTLPIMYNLVPGNLFSPNGQFANLLSGTYTLQVTDANNCTASTVVILSMPGLNFSVNTISNLSCTCAGSVEVLSVNGGIAPFNYSIAPLVNQPQPALFDNMCGGVYTITVSDINNCTGTSVINFNQIQVSESGNNSQCAGVNNATINCVATYGVPPYTYTLNPGNIVNMTGNFNSLAAGTYSVTVTDANLCVNTITILRTNLTQVNVNVISLDSVVCGSGANAVFAAFGNAGGPYTYTVQPVNQVNVNGMFNGLNAGVYTLSVNNAPGCLKVDSFEIGQASGLLPLPISYASYDESCFLSADGAIDINPSNPAGLTYEWNTGAFSQDLVNIVSGNYWVKVTGVSGDCVVHYDTVHVQGVNCGSISGRVFDDFNSNCIQDIGENNLSNIFLLLSNGASALTNMNGQYHFANVPYGNYSITQTPNIYFVPNSCVQPGNIVLNAANNIVTNANIKDSTTSLPDVLVHLGGSNVVPGFQGYCNILLINQYGYNVTVNAAIVLNDWLTFNNSLPANQGIFPVVGGDSVVWTNVNIPPYGIVNYTINFSAPANLPLGTTILDKAYVDLLNYTDQIPGNNQKVMTRIAAGAFDPNDKNVSPVGEGPNGNITLSDSLLDYRIRFQNTGTDSAHNIYILDTLSPNLELSSIRITAYSHPYEVEILNGNVLKLKFNNIMLPDSNVNEAASHGYISYQISQKAGNQAGDQIKNTAAIYFDFNAPVITNTTVNTIALPNGVVNTGLTPALYIYPNPADHSIFVNWHAGKTGSQTFDLLNVAGQILQSTTVLTHPGTNSIEIGISEFPAGILFLRSDLDGMRLYKIVKE